MWLSRASCRRTRGQALVEFSLVLPIFLLVLFGIVLFGLYVFYTQQVTTAARESARYAATHSATAQCPTVPWIDPNLAGQPIGSYARCDAPENGWPRMRAHGRSMVWGLDRSAVHVSACWSGYREGTNIDRPPRDASGAPYPWAACTIAGHDPVTQTAAMPCPAMTTSSDDQASARHENHVTVYACYRWSPPMAGILFMPSTVTIRAVVTEVIQRQQ